LLAVLAILFGILGLLVAPDVPGLAAIGPRILYLLLLLGIWSGLWYILVTRS
jgi:hypothetical protein